MRPLQLAAYGLAIGAMIAGGFVADRVFRGDGAGDGGTASAASGTRREDARPAPPIELPGLDGELVALSSFTGRPVLVNFWATWCKPCRKEIPLLMALRGEFADSGLEVVGVAIDEMEATRQLAGELGIDYPLMVGEQAGIDALAAFGAPTTALPYTAVLDREGRIVAGHVGELERDDALALLEGVL
jgi:thiol-disulfide isomerase/thioredoxin